MRALAQGGSNAVGGLARHAGTVVGEGWVKPNRRIFDNKKVSDHFAIIPTLQIPHDLSEAEGKLYDWCSSASWRCSSPPPNTASPPA